MRNFRNENNRSREPARLLKSLEPYDYGIAERQTKRNAEPARHAMTLPLGKALTVKHAYRISGQLPDLIVDERAETPEERHRSDWMEKIGWSVIRASHGETQFSSGGWDASELGAACFDMYWDDVYQIPRFRRIDPVGLVEVQGVDDPHNFQRVYRAWEAPLASVVSMYRDQEFRGKPVDVKSLTPSFLSGTTEKLRVVQMCDTNRVVRFALGADGTAPVGLYEFVHEYGFAPYVIIPNIGPYEDVWGWADYEFVRDLCFYLPALFSREADVIRTMAGGAMIERGTGQDPQEIKRVMSSGGVLPSRRDGSVEPIDTPEVPAFHDAHSGRAMDFLKMLGFAPDASWGMPGSGSGTDRGLQLQPLLEYTAMKQLNWSAGLSRLFSYAYRMIEAKMEKPASYRGAVPKGRGGRSVPFVLQFGPGQSINQDVEGPDGFPLTTELPASPKELFDGDYAVRFNWRNRVDPDDPQYVMSEMSKFTQGAQSLQTTLENLGIQNPEDEMRRIEKEAERFPWINQGLVSLLMAQFRGNAQGTGGGAPSDPAGALMSALGTVSSPEGGGQSGALNADLLGGSMPGPGTPFGAA